MSTFSISKGILAGLMLVSVTQAFAGAEFRDPRGQLAALDSYFGNRPLCEFYAPGDKARTKKFTYSESGDVSYKASRSRVVSCDETKAKLKNRFGFLNLRRETNEITAAEFTAANGNPVRLILDSLTGTIRENGRVVPSWYEIESVTNGSYELANGRQIPVKNVILGLRYASAGGFFGGPTTMMYFQFSVSNAVPGLASILAAQVVNSRGSLMPNSTGTLVQSFEAASE